MGDRKRRWICRVLFVLLCALPTGSLITLSFNRPTPKAIGQNLSHLLGIPVSIQSVDTPTPFKTVLHNVRFRDPEIGTVLLLNKLELSAERTPTATAHSLPSSTVNWTSPVAWTKWKIDRAEATESGLSFVGKKFHEALLRMRRRTGFPIEIQSLKVVRKPNLPQKGWESNIDSKFSLGGRSVLQLREVRLDRVTSPQIASASTNSFAHLNLESPSGESPSGTSSPQDSSTSASLPWKSGWALQANIVKPDTVGKAADRQKVHFEFHRLANTKDPQKNSSQPFLTFWQAQIGEHKIGKQIPYTWMQLDPLQSLFAFQVYSDRPTPKLSGNFSGILEEHGWSLQVRNLYAEGIDLSDLDRITCGHGPTRIAGECKVVVDRINIRNGSVKTAQIGIRASGLRKGKISNHFASQLNAHPSISINAPSTSLSYFEFQNLSIKLSLANQQLRLEPWDVPNTAVAGDGSPMIATNSNRLINTVELSQWLPRSPNATGAEKKPNQFALASFLPKPKVNTGSQGSPIQLAQHNETQESKPGIHGAPKRPSETTAFQTSRNKQKHGTETKKSANPNDHSGRQRNLNWNQGNQLRSPSEGSFQNLPSTGRQSESPKTENRFIPTQNR